MLSTLVMTFSLIAQDELQGADPDYIIENPAHREHVAEIIRRAKALEPGFPVETLKTYELIGLFRSLDPLETEKERLDRLASDYGKLRNDSNEELIRLISTHRIKFTTKHGGQIPEAAGLALELDEPTLQTIEKLWSSRHAGLRMNILLALGSTDSASATSLLIKFQSELADAKGLHPTTRYVLECLAIRALGLQEDAESFKLLRELFNHPRTNVAAVRALVRRGDSELIPYLEQRAVSNDSMPRIQLAFLEKLPQPERFFSKLTKYKDLAPDLRLAYFEYVFSPTRKPSLSKLIRERIRSLKNAEAREVIVADAQMLLSRPDLDPTSAGAITRFFDQFEYRSNPTLDDASRQRLTPMVKMQVELLGDADDDKREAAHKALKEIIQSEGAKAITLGLEFAEESPYAEPRSRMKSLARTQYSIFPANWE